MPKNKNNNKYGYEQEQTQEQISAYSWKTSHDLLIMTTEFLEKYIEVAGYYPDWQSRKQIHNNRVQRKDKSLEEAEKSFSTMLFLLYSNVSERPSSIREKLKEEFYQWINAAGIDVKNCPERLKNILFGLDEVLDGKGEKILEDVKNAKRDYEVGSPEYAEALNKLFSGVQNPLNVEEETLKSLEGKKWNEIEVGRKFGVGDNLQNEENFQIIKNSVSEQQKNFHFFPQKEVQQISSSSQKKVLTDKVKQNLNEWRIKEVVVFKGYFGGGEQKELALVHQEANLKAYNWQGYLEIDPRMVYFKKDHQPEEWVQIEKYYSDKAGISSDAQLNNLPSPTNSEIVQDIKNNPQNWKLDKITTENDNFGRAKKQEIMLIRRNARLNDFDQEGKLNFINNPIYKWNSFKVLQKFEIKKTLSENKIYLKKDYLTDDEISFVIKEFSDKPGVWKIEPIQGREYLINSSAQIKKNEIGTLIHNKEKFSNQEWVEIEEVLKLNSQYNTVLKKLSREIPLERGETYETLDIWAKELEKKLLINGIRKNASEWEIRKEIVALDFNEGEVLARKTAKINREEDYNLATGELINKPNELYRKDYFDDKELAEINAILISQELINRIKQHANEFRTEKMMVSDDGINYNGEVWIIDNSARMKSDKNGCLVFDPNKMVKVKDLTEAELKAIGYKSEVGLQTNSSPTTPKNDDKGIGKGGIIAIVSIIGAFTIAGIVVAKKKLNKKVKKQK